MIQEPMRLRTTGSNIKPWKSPKVLAKKIILNQVRVRGYSEPARGIIARKVENPPLKTAGPIFCMAATILSSLFPGSTRKL